MLTAARCSLRGIVIAALLVALTAVLARPAGAQLTDTTAFLADLANHYRILPDIVYHTANNRDLTLDLYLPAGAPRPTPVLLMIHGGGWVVGAKEAQSLRLLPYLEMGWAVVNVSYRLVEVSPAPAAVEDCLCALQWIARNARQYNFDVSRIVTSGHSAGGHLALTSAMVPVSSGLGRGCVAGSFDGPPTIPSVPVAAVVNWYGITDVADLISGPNTKGYAVQWLGSLPDRDAVARLVSPLSHVRSDLPPILTIHGDADALVPYQHAERLHGALDRAGVSNELHTVAGGGHGGFTSLETYAIYEAIHAFLGRHGLSAADALEPAANR